jgi:hypothetical protein
LVDSKERRVIGRFVFTYGTAPGFWGRVRKSGKGRVRDANEPASLSILTRTPSSTHGLFVLDEYPTLVSNPPTTTLSFKEMGIPASGPAHHVR